MEKFSGILSGVVFGAVAFFSVNVAEANEAEDHYGVPPTF